MKKYAFRKTAAVLLSGILALASLPAIPAAAEDALALRIAKVEVDAETLGEDRLVSVEVRLEGNERGFIASEFGIAFDERLTLAEIRSDSDAGRAFNYYCETENHMIWFSGASGDAEACATTGRSRLFTLDFILPENYSVRDTYYIGYGWNGIDGETAFWYTAPGEDQLTSLMTYSVSGSITIPDPNAPKLSNTELTLNRGTTYELTVQNVNEEGIWFSDDESVATVKDGVITAVAPGSCIVSVFYTAASTLLSCEVTVSNEFHYSMLDNAPVTISPNQVVWLDFPGAKGSIQWVSMNPGVLTVDENGKLTVLGEGTAQVIATNNGVSKMKSISVSYPSSSDNKGIDPGGTTTTESTTAATTTPVAGTTAPTLTSPVTSSTSVTTSAVNGTTSSTTATTTVGTPAVPVAGDLNTDSSIDIIDVILVNKYLLGCTDLNDSQKNAADVYHDGSIDSTDALTLLKYVVDLVEKLPVEPA